MASRARSRADGISARVFGTLENGEGHRDKSAGIVKPARAAPAPARIARLDLSPLLILFPAYGVLFSVRACPVYLCSAPLLPVRRPGPAGASREAIASVRACEKMHDCGVVRCDGLEN